MSDRRFDLPALGPAVFVLLCVAGGLLLDRYPQYVVAVAIIAMLVGVALVIVVGLGRCITLASGSIMAVGAYTATLAMLRLGLPYVAALLCALLAGAAAGWLIALPGTRFRGHNLAMVTLVFQSVCIILIRESTWLTGGAQGIRVPAPAIAGWKIVSDADFLLVIGLVAAAAILLLTVLLRGSFGKNLQAAVGNEVAAEAFGIKVSGYITAAFVVSSMAIGLAGALAAPRIRILDPDSFGVMLSIYMLAYPIVGGMNSIWGGLLGGGGLRALPELLRPVADYQELFFAVLVIVVVMFFPGGLTELISRSAAVIRKPRAAQRLKSEFAAVASPGAGVPAMVDEAPGEPLLRVAGVDKHFDALHAVNSADLALPAGGIHGLIGPNGAGKTSLFNIISGFLDTDAGSALFAGVSLLGRPARDRIRLGMTRTFQHVAVFGALTCLDNVVIGRGRNGVTHAMRESFGAAVGDVMTAAVRRDALAALDAVGLADQADAPARSLSLGDQRRLEIARAIVSGPKLIMLDEPVSGVAEREVEDLRQLLLRINRDHKVALLVVEHNIPFITQLCRSISVMDGGRIIAEGKPAEVISLPIVRQLYFGEEIAT